MEESKLKEVIKKHSLWLAGKGGEIANLSEANLSWADLRRANLSGANLSGADLDFSCWPLWCGSLDVKLDVKQKRQLLYHVLSVCPEYRTPELIEEANKFHRIGEVPRLCQKGKQNENNKP